MVSNLNFDSDGADWPNRAASRFVASSGLKWHVQEMGPRRDTAPVMLLLHGTGAATHSWRGLMPILAREFRVVAPDLPGHGFTDMPAMLRLSLPGMAATVARLVEDLKIKPSAVVGHSAGAAIGARMCLDGSIAPQCLISLSGALLPLDGAPGRFFSPTAKLLAMNPLVPRVFAWRARNLDVIKELLGRTGSAIDAEGLRHYAILARNARHAGAALGMMANWNLQTLARDLAAIKTRMMFVTAGRDRMIAPKYGERAHKMVPGSSLVCLDQFGHLAHEEAPETVAQIIADFAHESATLG